MTAEQPSREQPPVHWLVLVYRIPSEPTRLRSTAWRRLKALGAVYLQNSVAALPKDAASERALRKLRHDIIGMSGTAVLLDCDVLVGEETVMAVYQAARTDEYEELVDRCNDFLADVQKEWDAVHFTYAELEENEADYNKLVTWAEKIRDRDRFHAAGGEAAAIAVDRCHAALEDYAARVYAEEPEGH